MAGISEGVKQEMNHNPRMLESRSSIVLASSAASRWVLPVASLVVWGAVAFSAVTWGLRWSASDDSGVQAAPVAQALPDVNTSAVARSLGSVSAQPTAAPSADSRFQLQGVVTGDGAHGAALLVVDGKPAKPYRVGAQVADGWVLQSVQGRRVSLGASMDGPETLRLELPAKK